MKLLFCLFNYFPYGGLQRDFLHIVQACFHRGHSVTVYAMKWQGNLPSGIELECIPARGFSNHGKCLNFAKKVACRLRSERFDLVIGFNKMPNLDVYYAADPCYQAKIREQKGFFSRLGKRYRTYVALERSVFLPESKTHIFLIAEKEKEKFIRYYRTPEHLFYNLPPGIAKDRFPGKDAHVIREQVRKEQKIDKDEHMILMVGSGFRTKGLDRALLALASLPNALKHHTKLLVIGQGRAGPYQNIAKRLGVQKQTVFLGGRDDVMRFLLGADLLMHPAYSENTGTVLLEAMASGLPVLATDICGYAFHVKKAGAGLLIPSPFQQSLCNSFLKEMLTSRLREAWRMNGPVYVEKKQMFNLPEKAADLIESIAKRRSQL